MSYKLVILKGRSANQVIPLGPGPSILGRQPGCEITLRSSQVSRKHCQIFEKDGQLCVKDLGSSNGTFVNSRKIDGVQPLQEGDVLALGSIQFRIEAGTQPADKPGSTAIAEGVPAPVPLSEDDVFDLFADEPSEGETPAAPPPKTAPIKTAKTAKAPPTAKTSPTPKSPATPPPPPPNDESADEAVAEFLLNIELDDEKN